MDTVVQLFHTVTMGEDSASPSTSKSQKILISILAITGFIFLFSKIVSFIHLLFSLFILPGISVSHHPMINLQLFYQINFHFTNNLLALHVRPPQILGPRDRGL